MEMESKVDTNIDLGKLVFEGMMTVFIVLIFLFIVRNWVLSNVGYTQVLQTCSLSENKVGIGKPVTYESGKATDDYNFCKIRFDNM